MFRKSINLLAIVLVLTTNLASADLLKMRNSWKHYNGRLIKVDESQVYFQTEQGTLLKLPRTSVSELRLDGDAITLPVAVTPPTTESGTGLASPFPTHSPSINNALLQFPGPANQPDAQRFTWLAKFRGKSTQTVYAGLYRVPDRGTFWLNTGQTLTQPSRLSFKLYGKWNPRQAPDSFPIAARFLDANNQLIGETPMTVYRAEGISLNEWFEYLDGMSGVATEQTVSWRVPARTRTIELFVPNSKTPNALVGYISQLVLE